jgi:DNA polymerase III epsilon subunit-like protein
MSWHTGRLAGFDLETTGVDVETDRIVTACVVQVGGGHPTQTANWLANPGIDIPEGAAKIHGITTEQARTEGRPAAEVVEQVTAALAQVARDGIPIVTMNGSFDLTLLDREARRHGVQALFETCEPSVIDVRVLDKVVDKYRRGSRKLIDLCATYKVALDGAHSADADAIAACRVAWRIATAHPRIGGTPLQELHQQQITWAREQGESFADYLRQRPDRAHEADGVRTDWPLIPHQQEASS